MAQRRQQERKIPPVVDRVEEVYLRDMRIGNNPAFSKGNLEKTFGMVWFDESVENDTVVYHSHDFYEIVLCLEGGMVYLTGDAIHQIQAGDLMLIPPGVGHRPVSLGQNQAPNRRYGMWLSGTFVGELMGAFPELQLPESQARIVPGFAQGCPLGAQSFAQAWEATKGGGDLWQLEVLGCCTRLLGQIGRVLSRTEEPQLFGDIAPVFREILKYLEEHLGEKITLDTLSGAFYVSKSWVSQMFRTYLNTSFYQYLLQRRLVEAKNLMDRGMPLGQVAQKVGFSSYSNFYRAFFQAYGISPSAHGSGGAGRKNPHAGGRGDGGR